MRVHVTVVVGVVLVLEGVVVLDVDVLDAIVVEAAVEDVDDEDALVVEEPDDAHDVLVEKLEARGQPLLQA
jgi:hypothetical protein